MLEVGPHNGDYGDVDECCLTWLLGVGSIDLSMLLLDWTCYYCSQFAVVPEKVAAAVGGDGIVDVAGGHKTLAAGGMFC